jgi:hypothetical protein
MLMEHFQKQGAFPPPFPGTDGRPQSLPGDPVAGTFVRHYRAVTTGNKNLIPSSAKEGSTGTRQSKIPVPAAASCCQTCPQLSIADKGFHIALTGQFLIQTSVTAAKEP